MEFRQLLLSGLLLLFLTTSGWSNSEECFEEAFIVNGIKIGNISSEARDPCTHLIKIEIKAANLVDPEEDGYFNTPWGYPTMFLNYEIEGESDIVVVSNFEPDQQGQIHDQIYYWTHSFIVDITDHCRNKPPGTPVPYSFSLETFDGSFYPIHDYSIPQDVFTCQVFTETWCDCPNNCVPGLDDVDPEWIGDISLSCVNCFSGGADEYEDHSSNEHVEECFKVAPNPFSSDFILEMCLESASEIEIDIMDSNGKLLKNITKTAEIGIFRESVFTESWPNGIYFIQVKKNDEIETYRVIKAD